VRPRPALPLPRTRANRSRALHDFPRMHMHTSCTRALPACPPWPEAGAGSSSLPSHDSAPGRVSPDEASASQSDAAPLLTADAPAPGIPPGIHIVFVDDEPANCRLGLRMLQRLGVPRDAVTVLDSGAFPSQLPMYLLWRPPVLLAGLFLVSCEVVSCES
jgi:hypothetical protein